MRDVIDQAHSSIRKAAVHHAGGPNDLAKRATGYIELYRHSAGNHGFPMLAAHGALWGAGHFRRGHRVGWVLSHLARHSALERRRQLQMIDDFAQALKEINRRVFVETYTAYYMTDRFGDAPELQSLIPSTLIDTLNKCHAARRQGILLEAADRSALFEAFFLWEQENIVGPAIEAAVAKLDWPILRSLSVRPPIGFAYFRPYEWLWFKAFDCAEERIRRGRQAFEKAERCGWDRVEASLSDYGLLPNDVAPKRKGRLCKILETGWATTGNAPPNKFTPK